MWLSCILFYEEKNYENENACTFTAVAALVRGSSFFVAFFIGARYNESVSGRISFGKTHRKDIGMDIKGKKILFLGSSVTYGWASDGVSFVDIIGQRCGCECIKEAVSGTTIADIGNTSYLSRLLALDRGISPDLFVCQLGTNDATRNIPIDEIEDAMRRIIEFARETYGCPIVFYTNTYYDSEAYERMIELLFALGREYGIYVLDLFWDEEMRGVSEEDYRRFMKDRIHPTREGYEEWWTPRFLRFFEEIEQ